MGTLVFTTVVNSQTLFPAITDGLLKNIPPIRKLTLFFLGFKKLLSNSAALVELVSFVTLICDPYLEVSLV